jgi:hypothetical protein
VALPSIEVASERKSDSVEAATSAGEKADGKDLTKNQTDEKAFERPFGQAQQDYLRRLAEHLRTIDHELFVKDGSGITAIGVFGNDVFDKLLVLRALQPEFPEALFFTTDFDSALTLPSDLPWSRNLIIASSFGRELSEELQNDIPPFRSTYQTSDFLATQLAIGDFGDGAGRPDVGISKEGECSARIFEIERTGRVLRFPKQDDLKEEEKTKCLQFSSVPLQPPNKDLRIFPEWNRVSRLLFSATMCLLAFVIWISQNSHDQKTGPIGRGSGANKATTDANASPKCNWLALLVVIPLLFAALIAILWWWLADLLTQYGSGEPVALFKGVSLWPTIAMRILGLFASLYLIGRAWCDLANNWDHIVRKTLEMARQKPLDASSFGFWKRLQFTLLYTLDWGAPRAEDDYKVGKALLCYVYHSQFRQIWLRVAVYTILMFSLYLVLGFNFGFPAAHARGDVSYWLFWITTLVDVFFMLVLLFFVLDVTLLFWIFAKGLILQTEWPDEVKLKFVNDIGLKREKSNVCEDFDNYVTNRVIDYWIDIVFIEKRTKCISFLIYYPFFMISLMIFSRSAVFANFTFSPPILITEVLSLAIVFGCAIAMNRAAEQARRSASRKFAEAIIRAKKLDDEGRRAGQLESLRNCIEALNEGAFRPFLQQPVVGAVLLPLGATILGKGIPGL